MTLYDDLDAFLEEHRRCGEMDGGAEGPVFSITCDRGARWYGCGRELLRPFGRDTPATPRSLGVRVTPLNPRDTTTTLLGKTIIRTLLKISKASRPVKAN